jgi:hypothetical protein
MKNTPSFVTGLVTGASITALIFASMNGRVNAAPAAPDSNNPELQKLYDEDQADRTPPKGKAIDWAVVGPRDKAREARVIELYKSDSLKTGKDYHNAAMILQHASEPDRQLLGHEFCIVAISKGDKDAKWLCAATEDRFLMNIDRPQRFATQFRGTSPAGQPIQMKLYRVDPEVTDGLRREFNTPALAEAQKREQEMTDLFNGKKP